jgi:hypothetical protein
MSDAPQTPEPPHIQLARQALTSPTGQATTTLLVAQYVAATGALDLRDLPTTDNSDEHPDVLAALDAVVDSGAWRTVGARALLDSDDPQALFAEATKTYLQSLRLLANHMLTQRAKLGADVPIDRSRHARARRLGSVPRHRASGSRRRGAMTA